MTLWLILALMTVVAILAVIWPLVRHSVATRSGSDVVVYRDQLDEVERDLAAGLIGKTEAEAARIEISRRLLAAADAAKRAPSLDSTPTTWRRWAVAAVAVLLVPMGATALYLHVGSPGLPGEPLAARLQAPAGSQQQSIGKLVAQVELHLQKHPNDGKGWQVIAPVYMQLGRFDDAVNAWQKAIKLLGENADRLADLGEALTAQAGGIVTADAKTAFVRSVTLDSTTVIARYYLGLAAEQDGKDAKAAKIWRQLIADAPKGAKWVGTVRTALSRVEGKTLAPLPNPTAAELRDAAQKSPAQREAMAIDMVDRLASRLQKDGGNLSGWVQLVHSYKVMGLADKQQAAIENARKALADNPTKSKRFEAALKEIKAGKNPGVTPSMATTMPGSNATASASPPGPTSAQMVAAAKQSPAQRETMIRTMVGRLAAQMKKDGSNLQGWERLVRAYQVLGEADKHKAAIADARKALAGDPAKLKQFNASVGNDAAGPMTAAASAPTTGAAVDPPSAAAATPLPGPTPMQMLAAAEKQKTTPPPGHRMVRGMVEGLEKRLKTDTTDVKGWEMLVRSYKVLGERDKQKAAIENARRALAKDPAKLQQFDAALIRMEGSGGGATSAPQASGGMKQHQGQSIKAMVEGLHQRLKKSGNDPQGWLMLTRSYLTLKQKDKAMAAIQEARNALAPYPDKLDAFNAALKQFKIKAPQ